jgi:hypothetical protein
VLDEGGKQDLERIFYSFDLRPDGSISFSDFKERSVTQLAAVDPYAENKDPHGIKELFKALGESFENRKYVTKFEFFTVYREVWGTDLNEATRSKYKVS